MMRIEDFGTALTQPSTGEYSTFFKMFFIFILRLILRYSS